MSETGIVEMPTLLDYFRIASHTVVGNSGGKTSGYNLWLHLQANGGTLTDCGAAVFTNTGWEHPQTLDFLAEQERRWGGYQLVWLEFCRRAATVDELTLLREKWQRAEQRAERFQAEPASFFMPRRKPVSELFAADAEELKAEVVRKASKYRLSCWHSLRKAELIGMDSYRRVNRDTASVDGGPFQELLEGLLEYRREVKDEPGILPNGVQRICTGHLKIRCTSRFAKDFWCIPKDAFECRLGLRADEEERVFSAKDWGRDGGKATFPLYEAGITKADVAAFWAKQPFRLTLKSHEGNCGGCYMKRRNALVDLIQRDFFDLSWWENWEARTGQRFRNERSYHGLRNAARMELDMLPPEDGDNGITCEGGYCTD